MPHKNHVIADILQRYHGTRNERLKLDQQSAKLKVAEDKLLDELGALHAESGNYGMYSLEAGSKLVPRVTDWPGFHAYILQTGNIDMLTKHLTASAINARIEDGEYVPGVVFDTKPTFKITAN